jgi:hypothetical protein
MSRIPAEPGGLASPAPSDWPAGYGSISSTHLSSVRECYVILRALLSCSFSLTAYPTCFPLTQFTCNNGRCININWRCDNGKSLPPSPALIPVKTQSHSQILDGEGRSFRIKLGFPLVF